MKTIISIILVAFSLSACKSPQIAPQTRVLNSQKFGKCFCQTYDLNAPANIDKFVECAMENCDDMVGFKADAWAYDITPWGKELRRWGEDSCKPKPRKVDDYKTYFDSKSSHSEPDKDEKEALQDVGIDI